MQKRDWRLETGDWTKRRQAAGCRRQCSMGVPYHPNPRPGVVEARGLLALVLALLLVLSAGAATVDEILAKYPAEDATGQAELSEALLELGEEGILDVAGRLVPSGTADLSARYALSGLVKHAGRPDARAVQRGVVSEALVSAAGAAESPEVAAFLLEEARFVVGSEAIGPLARFLADPRLCDPAARALVTVGSYNAGRAVLDALADAPDECLPTLVQALGEMRVPDAVQALTEIAISYDGALQDAVILALANIGAPESEDALRIVIGSATGARQASLLDAGLLYARRQAEEGREDKAEALAREIGAGPVPSHVRAAALALLVDLRGVDALPYLALAVIQGEPDLRAEALRMAESLGGTEVTSQWIQLAAGASPEVQADVAEMLGRRGDVAALAALPAEMQSPSRQVRIASMVAAMRLDPGLVLPHLLAYMRQAEELEEIRTAAGLIARCTVEDTLAQAADALPGANDAAKAALLRVLSQRGATGEVPAVLAETDCPAEAVRIAALSALGALAPGERLPRMVQLLLAAKTEDERTAARDALVAVARRVEDESARTAPVLAALEGANAETTGTLLGVLPRVGTDDALAALVERTRSDDGDLARAAVRALADWPDGRALSALEGIMRDDGAPLARRVLALRGYVRIVEDSKAAAGKKAEQIETAWEHAPRAEEKRLVLSVVGKLRAPEALALAGRALDSTDVAEDAARAVVAIVFPRQDGAPRLTKAAVPVLRRTIPLVDAGARQGLLECIFAAEHDPAGNLARRGDVSQSRDNERGHGPRMAVDGSIDRARYWSADRAPAALTVDLGEPTDIGAVWFFPWWDGERSYRYTVESSTDGEHWTMLVDRGKNRKAATFAGDRVDFAPVSARYVRANMLGNSANAAVHAVELEVYPATKEMNTPPEGFSALFNGTDLSGWKGLVGDPVKRARMSAEELAAAQAKADDDMRAHWTVQDGALVFDGMGKALCTARDYRDFEMYVDWKIGPGGDSGIYLRGSPQVQIWDPLEHPEGSGGLYNNQKHASKPTVCADFTTGAWNTFYIKMAGERVTVDLNGVRVVDDVPMENYWERDKAIYPTGQIELQNHGSTLWFRNIYLREL